MTPDQPQSLASDTGDGNSMAVLLGRFTSQDGGVPSGMINLLTVENGVSGVERMGLTFGPTAMPEPSAFLCVFAAA